MAVTEVFTILFFVVTVANYSGLFDRAKARIQRHPWFNPEPDRPSNSELQRRVSALEVKVGIEGEIPGEAGGAGASCSLSPLS
ncbi:hypothetical protein F4825DRAFT_422053 [Nemania diffusa]|nr:hypothetical protein F4825DRAFT_422053 [Nemania diffusa]